MTLLNSNFGTDGPSPSPICYHCGGVPDRDRPDMQLCAGCREEWERAELARWRAAVVARYLRSGFPPHVLPSFGADITREGSGRASAREKITALLSGSLDAYCVYLHGEAGTGKSFEAARAGLAVLAAGGGAIFTSSVDYGTRIVASYNRGASESTEKIVKELETTPLLVLDDLGAERATAHAIGRLFELLDSRYRNVRPTIITSNHTLAELARHVAQGDGELQAKRIADRLREMAVAARLSGGSLRATKKPVSWAALNAALRGIPTTSRIGHFSEADLYRKPVLEAWEWEAAKLLPESVTEAAKRVNRELFGMRRRPAEVVV